MLQLRRLPDRQLRVEHLLPRLDGVLPLLELLACLRSILQPSDRLLLAARAVGRAPEARRCPCHVSGLDHFEALLARRHATSVLRRRTLGGRSLAAAGSHDQQNRCHRYRAGRGRPYPTWQHFAAGTLSQFTIPRTATFSREEGSRVLADRRGGRKVMNKLLTRVHYFAAIEFGGGGGLTHL